MTSEWNEQLLRTSPTQKRPPHAVGHVAPPKATAPLFAEVLGTPGGICLRAKLICLSNCRFNTSFKSNKCPQPHIRHGDSRRGRAPTNWLIELFKNHQESSDLLSVRGKWLYHVGVLAISTLPEGSCIAQATSNVRLGSWNPLPCLILTLVSGVFISKPQRYPFVGLAIIYLFMHKSWSRAVSVWVYTCKYMCTHRC